MLTKTYRKATAANTLLLADSHHPRPLVKGIPVGQFLRMRKNCSTEEDYHCESDMLYRRFRERGYSHRTLKQARKIAGSKTRKDLLSIRDPASSEQEEPDRLIMQYGDQWNQIGSILLKHCYILTRPSGMEDIVRSRPHMVPKRARNLDDILVQSGFVKTSNRNWLTDMPRLNGMFPCGHCGICRHVDQTFYQLRYCTGTVYH